MLLFFVLSFFAGAAIALQASLNAHLGQLLTSSLLATVIAFISGAIYLSLAAMILLPKLPPLDTLRSVPVYLWFSGGFFGAFAVASFYYLIPKIGVATMLSFSLSGQLILGLVASHFGWFNLPISSISPSKLLGLAGMITSIFLINR